MTIISADSIKADLKHQLVYLHLMSSLSTQKYNVVKNPELKREFIGISESIDEMDYNALLVKAPIVLENLKSLTDYFV